jgi:hypothetical protein
MRRVVAGTVNALTRRSRSMQCHLRRCKYARRVEPHAVIRIGMQESDGPRISVAARYRSSAGNTNANSPPSAKQTTANA